MTEPTIIDVRNVLGAHGYGFQYAVLRRAEKLAAERRSRWVFEGAEFPVGTAESPTHIDFILRNADSTVYLVSECERADPAHANWCFLKAPYTRRDSFEAGLVFQEVVYQAETLVVAQPRTRHASLECTHLGFELRTGAKGEGSGGRGAINDATAQVLRGSNGLIDHLFPKQRAYRGDRRNVVFVPVIFTTARLWVAKGDLGAADLTTGRLNEDWGELISVPWLWYTYNQSPALRHRLPSASQDQLSLSETLHAEYSRTIAIVGSDGIDTFLSADLISWL
jgi:hypothetical protein